MQIDEMKKKFFLKLDPKFVYFFFLPGKFYLEFDVNFTTYFGFYLIKLIATISLSTRIDLRVYLETTSEIE